MNLGNKTHLSTLAALSACLGSQRPEPLQREITFAPDWPDMKLSMWGDTFYSGSRRNPYNRWRSPKHRPLKSKRARQLARKNRKRK